MDEEHLSQFEDLLEKIAVREVRLESENRRSSNVKAISWHSYNLLTRWLTEKLKLMRIELNSMLGSPTEYVLVAYLFVMQDELRLVDSGIRRLKLMNGSSPVDLD